MSTLLNPHIYWISAEQEGLSEDSQDVLHSFKKSSARSWQSKKQHQYVKINEGLYCPSSARGITLYSHVTSPRRQLLKKSLLIYASRLHQMPVVTERSYPRKNKWSAPPKTLPPQKCGVISEASACLVLYTIIPHCKRCSETP